MTLLERLFHPAWFMPTAIFVVRWFAKLFYGLEVTGTENVPAEGGAVLACNHLSTWDPPIVGSVTPRRLEFMAKKELFASPFSAAALRGLRAFPVDRQGQDIGAIKEALRRLNEGRVVGIFVQGTRNVGDAAAFDGAAFLAQRAKVPVVPAAIWREGRAFHVRYGTPIVPTGSTRRDVHALTVETMAAIQDLIPSGRSVKSEP